MSHPRVCGCFVSDEDIDSDGIIDCADPKVTMSHVEPKKQNVTIGIGWPAFTAHTSHGDMTDSSDETGPDYDAVP
ncbi:MAG TPA: hypothetical protein VML55_22905 [Planctomycetaceae bacterium]|nr:hypothetical protein [Planctomycetaceae bacterium]